MVYIIYIYIYTHHNDGCSWGYQPTIWSAEVGQADLKAGHLPAAVAQLFHGGSPKPEPKPKRLRM